MKNFIEVGKTDEEQAEQIKKWIKENAPQIIIGISLGLSGIWGFEYYKNQQHEQSIQARGYYLSVVANPNDSKTFDALKEHHTKSDYAQQANLMMAKQASTKGDYQSALNYLLPLINSKHEFTAHNAKLRIAHVYLAMGNHDKALSVLEGNENEAFNALYNHAKGDIYFAQNKLDFAKKYYQLALTQLPADSKLINLIQIKLSDF